MQSAANCTERRTAASRVASFCVVAAVYLTVNVSQAADVRWVTAKQIGPAYVKTDFQLDSRTMTALSHLSSNQTDLATKLGLTIPTTPVQITIFRSRRAMDSYVRARIPEGAGRAALFVKSGGSSQVYAHYNRNLEVDIRHESTHAFLHAALPYVPLWLDEGIAEYFEVAPSNRFSKHEHLKSLKRAMWFRWKPNLDRLEALTSLSDMQEDEYRESWAWVHFMMHGPPAAQNVLKDYLHEIAAGGFAGPIAPKLRAAVPNLDKKLKDHLKAVR